MIEEVESFADLISCKSVTKELELPDVRRIKDIRKFMADKNNYNGNINELINRMTAKSDQCESVLKVLKDKLELKMATLHKVKQDMMELNQDLKTGGATKKYVTEKTKIAVRFMDEVEVHHLDIPTSLEKYNSKIDALFNEIMGLDGDIDYVNFLTGIAMLNINYVMEFHKIEQAESSSSQEEPSSEPSESV